MIRFLLMPFRVMCVCIWWDGLMTEHWPYYFRFWSPTTPIQIHTSNMYAFLRYFSNKIHQYIESITITMAKHSPSGHTIKKTTHIGIVQVSASRCPNGICKSRNCFFVLFGPYSILLRQFFIVSNKISRNEEL